MRGAARFPPGGCRLRADRDVPPDVQIEDDH